MKPLIGITPDTDDGERIKTRVPEERIIYLWDRYAQAVMDAGGLAVVLPVCDDRKLIKALAARLDGLALAGGNFDVPPEYYGESPRPWLGTLKPARSWFERELLGQFLKSDKPVLGICGGMQIINVARGGSLYQDIVEEAPNARDHRQKIPKNRTSHSARVEPGSSLAKIFSGRSAARPFSIRVNSTHHQAVKQVGRGLRIAAVAPDGVIEAIESEVHRFVVGVQWHPELLYKKHLSAARLFAAFIRACRE